MTAFFCHSHALLLFFSCFLFLILSAYSIQFQILRFDPQDANILYRGDAVSRGGAVEFNNNLDYLFYVGSVIYAENIPIWDSTTGKVTDFTTHFTFFIDTQGSSHYASGLAFFLAPVGFQIPTNSGGGFLGLFNTTTSSDSPEDHIVLVEFDTFENTGWDPPGVGSHVGINVNSISSSIYTPWNASFHSGDTADVWITYDATTKNLSASWEYRKSFTSRENTTLSYSIDLKEVLNQWVAIGFSAATSYYVERHVLQSWEFNSTLGILDVTSGKKTKKTRVVVIVSIAGAVLIVGGAFTADAIFRSRKKLKSGTREGRNLTSIDDDDLERGAGPRKFSYQELVLATNNFSRDRKLGQGGFGAVYRGYFADLDLTVAVKKISRGSKQGKREYLTEVKVISRLRHRNLVQLRGWCHEKGEFLLVYEFMPNGSLDFHLFGKRTTLSWSQRHKITLGLASAVLYLHEEWEQCVVHRDIKPSNVMLDSSFNVKLGDFGLAKLMDHELGHETTGLAGTLAYMAPEYISTRRASKGSDVYSFGLVALEIATGRKAVNLVEDKDGEKGLVKWVWDHYGREELLVAVDERLQTNIDEKQVECLMILGLWCCHPDSNLRPTIRQAIQVLNFEASLPHLPKNMPIPMYHVSTPSEMSPASISESLQMGR